MSKRTSKGYFRLAMAVLAIGSLYNYSSDSFSNETQDSVFAEWAKKKAIPIATTKLGSGFKDLLPLKDIIGDARVVSFGESAHGIREFNELKVRIFEFLVEEMGFTAFAMESGLPNSKLVYDYVLGANTDLEKVLKYGFSYDFGPWEETVVLLEYMRDYNADPSHTCKIHFYGMDIFSMGPFNKYARTVSIALEGALSYLDTVDSQYAASVRKSLLPKVMRFKNEKQYNALSLEDRKDITTELKALITKFEIYRIPYIKKSSRFEYEWAFRQAIVASQVNVHYAFKATEPPDLDGGNSREMGMADNLKWILEQEGPGSRVMVWAHNGHVVKSFSQSDKFWTVKTGPFRDVEGKITLLGLYLESIFGDDYVNFGFTNNQYVFDKKSIRDPMFTGMGFVDKGPAVENSFSAALRQVGRPLFALDLRTAPKSGPVNDWLAHEHPMRYQHMYMNLIPIQAWDALIYFEEVTLGHKIELEN